MRSSFFYLTRSVSGCAFMCPALLPLSTELFLCVFKEFGRGPQRSLCSRLFLPERTEAVASVLCPS